MGVVNGAQFIEVALYHRFFPETASESRIEPVESSLPLKSERSQPGDPNEVHPKLAIPKASLTKLLPQCAWRQQTCTINFKLVAGRQDSAKNFLSHTWPQDSSAANDFFLFMIRALFSANP